MGKSSSPHSGLAEKAKETYPAFVQAQEVDRSQVSEDEMARINLVQEKAGNLIAANQIKCKAKRPNLLED